jgi:hypothetical protein
MPTWMKIVLGVVVLAVVAYVFASVFLVDSIQANFAG